MARKTKYPECTKCGRPNTRGGRTRVCTPCYRGGVGIRLAEPPLTKVCAFCRTEKAASEFYKNSARNDWLSTYCKVCHSSKAKDEYASDAERAKDRRLWSRYNITLEEYNQLLVAQGYRCALCPRKHTDAKPLNVDHSHEEPYIVRGLLCIRCNQRKLGALTLEDVQDLHAYLTTPPATLTLGQRLVPIGMEQGRPGRRRKYRHYAKNQTEVGPTPAKGLVVAPPENTVVHSTLPTVD